MTREPCLQDRRLRSSIINFQEGSLNNEMSSLIYWMGLLLGKQNTAKFIVVMTWLRKVPKTKLNPGEKQFGEFKYNSVYTTLFGMFGTWAQRVNREIGT